MVLAAQFALSDQLPPARFVHVPSAAQESKPAIAARAAAMHPIFMVFFMPTPFFRFVSLMIRYVRPSDKEHFSHIAKAEPDLAIVKQPPAI